MELLFIETVFIFMRFPNLKIVYYHVQSHIYKEYVCMEGLQKKFKEDNCSEKILESDFKN